MKWSRFLDHSEKISLLNSLKPTDLLVVTNLERSAAYLYEEWSKGYPVYCVRKSLIKEMLETDVGENISLFKNIDLVLPTYLLCFPKSTIKSPIGNGFIDYMIVNIAENNINESENNEYKYLIFWGGFDSNNNLLLSGKGVRWDGTIKKSKSIDSEIEVDAAFLIRNIVLQSVLLLQNYPEIQEEMKSIATSKPKGFRKDTEPLDYRLPRWLGSEKTAKEYSERSESTSTRETAKTTTHYRSWHWRLQPCGEGRKDIKPVRVRGTWINPVLEN
jgi:hypothetical protein